jgi:hypothetical protein
MDRAHSKKTRKPIRAQRHAVKVDAALDKLEEVVNAQAEKKDRMTKFDFVRHLCVLLFLQEIKENPRSCLQSSNEVAKLIFGKEKGSDYKARCLRIWSDDFIKTHKMSPYRQGKHQKTESLMDDSDIRQACLSYLRSQRTEIIDALTFSKWVSEQLHQNYNLCLLQPVIVSERTARRWLHLLGFELSERKKKGTYTDGHERPDVVSYRKEYSSEYLEQKIARSSYHCSGFWKCSKIINEEWTNSRAEIWKQ